MPELPALKYQSECPWISKNFYYSFSPLSRGFIQLQQKSLATTSSGSCSYCIIFQADFGFSKKLEPTTKTWTFAGTPEYVAPEIILNEGHNRAVDYWTLGIFIYELLVGKPPFRGHNHSKTFTLILKGIDSASFPKHMNKTAQLLIRKLCRRVPAERLGYQREGIDGIRKHKWFQNFDWKSLQQTRLKAPYTPKVTGPTDLSNFDKYAKEKEIPPDEFGDWDANF